MTCEARRLEKSEDHFGWSRRFRRSLRCPLSGRFLPLVEGRFPPFVPVRRGCGECVTRRIFIRARSHFKRVLNMATNLKARDAVARLRLRVAGQRSGVA